MPAKKTTKKTARKTATLSAADLTKSGEIPWHPATLTTASAKRGGKSVTSRSATSRAAELPIGQTAARKVTRWLMTHFSGKLTAAGQGTPFSPDILCAIVCQETAYFWLPLLEKLESKPEFKNDPTELADLILARCVLDASGDHPDSPRSVFPKNTDAFLKKYGSEFTNFLIAEANDSRKLRGYGPKQWVYKGYGLFQYDLQFVLEDEAFFRERKWYDFDACLAKCIGELKKKYKAVGNDLWEAIRAYNGSGPRARAYRDNVKAFAAWTKDEIDNLSIPKAIPVARGAAKPATRPRLSQTDLAAKLAPFAIDRAKYPLVVVGIRGYYMDTLGKPGVNDRGIYDDAIFIDSPDGFASYNGNTDPSKFRPGSGFGSAKGMAKLNAGAWYAHKLDFHGSKVFGPYRAICQRLGKVTVTRDGNPPYQDTGSDFGINIHKGSYNGTSSEGSRTVRPDQWENFISMAMDLAKRYYAEKWDKTVIPYILIEA